MIYISEQDNGPPQVLLSPLWGRSLPFGDGRSQNRLLSSARTGEAPGRPVFFQNITRHEDKVKQYFEKRGVKGKKYTALIHTEQPCQFSLPFQQMQPVHRPRHPRSNPRPTVQPSQNENDVFEMVEFQQDDQQHHSEEDIQNQFPDLFGCFSNEGFDPERFNAFAQEFLKQVPVCMDRKEFDKVQSEKAKIISTLAQNLYIICTLSREQMKNITVFWKAMISFIAPRQHLLSTKSM